MTFENIAFLIANIAAIVATVYVIGWRLGGPLGWVALSVLFWLARRLAETIMSIT